MNRNKTGIVLTDNAGKEIYSIGNADRRNMVPLGEISDDMKHALIASEDKDFYSAGATAAIYAARKGIRTGLVAERFGGQVNDTMEIANYPGVPETNGPAWAAQLE